MKNVYRVGDDFFVAMAFISFVVGVVVRIFDATKISLGVSYKEAMALSFLCLLFSIALTLHDAK